MLHPIDLLHAQTLISLIQFGLDPVGFLAAVGAAAFRRALPQALREICWAFVRHVAISRVISSGIRQDARAFGRLPGVGATTLRPLIGSLQQSRPSAGGHQRTRRSSYVGGFSGSSLHSGGP